MGELKFKQKYSGREKQVSEQVYPSDILADTQLMQCSPMAFGAWMKCLLHMWSNKICEISGDSVSLARLWNCLVSEADAIIEELCEQKPCNISVHKRDGERDVSRSVVQKYNGNYTHVTLVSRRLERKQKNLSLAAKRAREYRRKKVASCENHDRVTDEFTPSSLSLSLTEIHKNVSLPPYPPGGVSKKKQDNQDQSRQEKIEEYKAKYPGFFQSYPEYETILREPLLSWMEPDQYRIIVNNFGEFGQKERSRAVAEAIEIANLDRKPVDYIGRFIQARFRELWKHIKNGGKV